MADAIVISVRCLVNTALINILMPFDKCVYVIERNHLSLLILEKEDHSNVEQKKETAQENVIPRKIRGKQFVH